LSCILAFANFLISKGQGIVKAKIQDKEGKGHEEPDVRRLTLGPSSLVLTILDDASLLSSLARISGTEVVNKTSHL
jgi:hypothetical protein